ncbi:hypothetical protein C7967_10671 [Thalassospira sp. 11-3]|nr:hypothetical protein C7967_10671 [Thalassospira sp. 11-3]
MTPRPMAFPARATRRTPTRPTADDGPNDKPPPPKPDFPQPGKSRRTRDFGIPANRAQTNRLRPHGPLGRFRSRRHFRQPENTEQTSGLRQPHQQATSGAPAPVRSCSAMAALSANRGGPDKLRAHGPHLSTIVGPQLTAAPCCHCCHSCRSRQIECSFPKKTHLSRHDK